MSVHSKVSAVVGLQGRPPLWRMSATSASQLSSCPAARDQAAWKSCTHCNGWWYFCEKKKKKKCDKQQREHQDQRRRTSSRIFLEEQIFPAVHAEPMVQQVSCKLQPVKSQCQTRGSGGEKPLYADLSNFGVDIVEDMWAFQSGEKCAKRQPHCSLQIPEEVLVSSPW